MFAREAITVSKSGHQSRQFRVLAFLLLVGLLMAACGPEKIVRVPVPQENIIKANEMAREADLAFARKDFYTALIKYLEASRLNPNSEYIQNKLGIAYSQLKYYSEAASAFQRSIGLNPKYAYSYNNMGTVLFASGENKGAERYFRKAISLAPDVASFHMNMGNLYFEQRKMKRGMAELRKALTLDPAILSKSEGISLAAAGAQRSPSEKSYFMARLFGSMGDAERAVESLKQAFNSGFSDVDAIQKEADFDPVRADQRFIAFMKTATLITRQ